MDHRDLLSDAATRPLHAADQVLADITDAVLYAQPDGRGNTIAWLIWHAARQADVQLSELTGTRQIWDAGGWAETLGIDRGAENFGFGDTPEQVAALRVTSPGALRDYLSDVTRALVTYAAGCSAEDLDEVIDRNWTPPVTRGVRLISIIDDEVTHLGQAAYARGILETWTIGY
ncbi:MAG: mycothiol transferase [Arachnia sp.]